MLSTALRRTLLKSTIDSNAAFAKQVRLASSMTPYEPGTKKQQRNVHSTSRQEADASAFDMNASKEEVAQSSGLLNRFIVTAEVTVSKIFPAGFGWQTSSIIAENNLGYAADTMAFAYTTGFGDAVGVLLGHLTYYGGKKALVDRSINMTQELHTGILLGSAAFCSGTVWQPLVNALQGANLSFTQVFVGTWVGCGSAFYFGLRGGRTILSGYLKHVEEPTYANSQTDMSLSTAIGGATGFFVGTDAAYMPDQNFLINVVGIADGTPDLQGCAIAGSSTALGFVTAQTGLNVIFPAGKCWND